MGRKPKSRPSFLKTVLTCSTPYLRLPPLFVEKYGEILPEKAKLRTSSVETWNVKLERIGDEYRFTQGWTKFAADVGLSIGEFLGFRFNVEEATFDVLVCGINGCGRQISPTSKDSPVEDSDSDEDVKLINAPEVKNNNQSSRRDIVENEAGTHDYISEEAHPHFIITLKEHQRSRVWLRKDFAEAAGLLNQKAVVLQYPPEQRCWPALLSHYECTQFRLDIGAGWNEFRRKNGLLFGKTYMFEYIPDKNVIEVKLFKKEN